MAITLLIPFDDDIWRLGAVSIRHQTHKGGTSKLTKTKKHLTTTPHKATLEIEWTGFKNNFVTKFEREGQTTGTNVKEMFTQLAGRAKRRGCEARFWLSLGVC
jgi:hypothetical protein